MADDFDSFIEDLTNGDADREEMNQGRTKASKEEKFPCGQCAGTGFYQGARVHQTKSHCFACKGKGYFKTDPRKLQERRNARRANEAKAKREAIAQFATDHPDMFKELRHAHDFQDASTGFIASLAEQLFRKGSLTENQIAAWYRGKARFEQVKAERAAQAEANKVDADLTPIRTMFETAVTNGYKRPTYRAEGLVINRAPDSGRNPGALYVKDEAGEYMGKVVGTTFHPVRNAGDAGKALLVIAQGPLDAALRYGQRTGRCACCGRELTNHASIELGIGPVCREKWGL